MAAVLVSAKVSVFYSKINKIFPKSSQRFYLGKILLILQRLHQVFPKVLLGTNTN